MSSVGLTSVPSGAIEEFQRLSSVGLTSVPLGAKCPPGLIRAAQGKVTGVEGSWPVFVGVGFDSLSN